MIRAGEPRDYDAYVRLVAELGTDDPVPAKTEWEASYLAGLLVFERGGEVVGYTSTRMLETAAHVTHVSVAPQARRTGVARALMNAVADRVRERGLREWHLNVKEHNAPAIALYESLGMRRAYRSAFTRLAWDKVGALPEEPELVFSLVAADDERALEAQFGILPGRLGVARMRGGRVIAQVRDAVGAVGVASFDPKHPGCFPFCAARPAGARALLDGLRPHARPGDAWLGVAVENDDALIDALVAAGADVRMRILHYRGEL